MNFNFVYFNVVYITNYGLKGKVCIYIENSSHDILINSIVPKICLWMFDTEQLDEIHTVLACLDQLTTVSLTPHQQLHLK